MARLEDASDYFPFPARPDAASSTPRSQQLQHPPLSSVSVDPSVDGLPRQKRTQHRGQDPARQALEPRRMRAPVLPGGSSTLNGSSHPSNGFNSTTSSSTTTTTTTTTTNSNKAPSTTSANNSVAPPRVGSMNRAPTASSTKQVPSLPVSSYSFSHPHAPSHSTIVMASRGRPLVYPAMLSRVAYAFVELLQAGDRVKNSLTYKNAFSGAEAVDLLMYILQTPDRTLALLLGRALDSMKLFHDVTYAHKLRDHADEIYQLRDVADLDSPATPALVDLEEDDDEDDEDEEYEEEDDLPNGFNRPRRPHHRQTSAHTPLPLNTAPSPQQAIQSVTAGVNGIFMLMTECYSPTCTRSQVCYAVHCPKRLEQQFRAKELHPSPSIAGSSATTLVPSSDSSSQNPISSTTGTLRRQDSSWSLNNSDDNGDDDSGENKLWIHTVSQEVADSVDDREKRRQEIICEVIYTERDFVKDLEYLRDFWIIPLRKSNIIPEHRREKFIRTVFSNVMEVHAVNSRLADALTKRQMQAPVVRCIGDIMLEHVPRFSPFIKYGANQLYGKHEFEREKSTNYLFAKFVEETERKKESRKLELNGYLTKPTTRLARYPLLLEAVLKLTPDESSDRRDLAEAISLIKGFLSKVNVETGKASDRYELMQLSQSLVFPPGEYVDLKLTDEDRQILFQQVFKKRLTDQQGDVTAYLLDHCLLFVKKKTVNRREQSKVFRKPIPLELLVVSQSEEGLGKRQSSSLISSARAVPSRNDNGIAGKHPLTFTHLGRRGYDLTLYAPASVVRKKWAESIEAQQQLLREKNGIYTKTILCTGYFDSSNRVNCAVPLDGGRKMLYGTDNGIYMSDTRPTRGASEIARPRKMLAVPNITQLDVLEKYSMLLALSDRNLLYWSLDTLETDVTHPANGNGNSNVSAIAAARKPKKVATHINFFKSGVSLGRVLVCTVKTNAMTTTVRALEPEEPHPRGRKQTTFRRLLQGQSEGLKSFKDFYVPSEAISLSFLKSKVCIGCAKGFEIVSLETLDTQSLLDPADTSLDFVMNREGLKPIAIYRLNGDFLLNYSDFSFFVNRNGWRSRSDWMIHWEGLPQSFALSYPYILAFEPSFIEIRHVESGALVHIITGENIRFLHESTNEILYVYEDDHGVDVVAWLDFWGSAVARPAGEAAEGVQGLGINGAVIGRQRLDD